MKFKFWMSFKFEKSPNSISVFHFSVPFQFSISVFHFHFILYLLSFCFIIRITSGCYELLLWFIEIYNLEIRQFKTWNMKYIYKKYFFKIIVEHHVFIMTNCNSNLSCLNCFVFFNFIDSINSLDDTLTPTQFIRIISSRIQVLHFTI